MFDVKDETTGMNNMKAAVMKIKCETYTYVRLYKSTKEVTNLIFVNPVFEIEPELVIGSCKITPYRG